MKKELISEISIINGKLNIRPQHKTFEYIYRSAMEVHWNEERKCLYSPVPRGWTYLKWFKQIHSAVIDEYGYFLEISENTIWNNIPEELKLDIMHFYKNSQKDI